MTVLLPLVAFLCVLGFTLCLVGAIENRRDRDITVIDLRRENIRRALAASRRYTGRAWTAADISAPRYGASLHGADRGDPRPLLGGEGHRNLSDARLPLRVVDGRQTALSLVESGSTRATPTAMSTRGRLPAENDTASTTPRSRRGI